MTKNLIALTAEFVTSNVDSTTESKQATTTEQSTESVYTTASIA